MTKNIFIFWIFILISFFEKTIAQPSLFDYNEYISKSGDTLKYRLLYPDYNPKRLYPLIVFLHGGGECGNDNERQLKFGITQFANAELLRTHPCIVIAPQCPEKESWMSSTDTLNIFRLKSNPSKPMEMVIGLIHQLIKDLPVDTNRIYITGMSLGGFGTFEALERYPHLFAAAVPICGGGDTSKVDRIKHIPIWAFHGSEDVVVNPQKAIDMIIALRKRGAAPGLTLLPEVGHFSWNQAYSDPVMKEWLFKQHKK